MHIYKYVYIYINIYIVKTKTRLRRKGEVKEDLTCARVCAHTHTEFEKTNVKRKEE